MYIYIGLRLYSLYNPFLHLILAIKEKVMILFYIFARILYIFKFIDYFMCYDLMSRL